MNTVYPWYKGINLHVKGRIAKEDALRQKHTAKAILARLGNQPGLILADEVGMGKTFVALAVALSVALDDHQKRPVVVMVPPSLKEKWPTDFQVFCERCLPKKAGEHLAYGVADNGVDFLKHLDDPPERKKQLIFATHGAMSRGLDDPWVKLAIIRQAVLGRKGADSLRRSLSKIMGKLLRKTKIDRQAANGGEELWYRLLTSNPSIWLKHLQARHIDPEDDNESSTDDDPVPAAVLKALPNMDTSGVYDALGEIPLRKSKRFDIRVTEARRAINDQMQELWRECLTHLDLRLPLLILDEAHHLKNPKTRLASLFHVQEAKDDVEEISSGPLGRVFERMLFLTATPFQLGHAELCSVLQRFTGIAWDSPLAPAGMDRDKYEKHISDLRSALDSAQDAALALDAAWSHLRKEDLRAGDSHFPDASDWWEHIQDENELTTAGRQVRRCYLRTRNATNKAQGLLQLWVVRHLRSRKLAPPHSDVERRCRVCGQAICTDNGRGETEKGIPLQGEALLPFLLAARAAYQAPESRPLFAEGLASSYEAFLTTRQVEHQADEAVEDETKLENISSNGSSWHLDQLERLLSDGGTQGSAAHPKIAATVERVVKAWSEGEKVLVFCHWVVTGKVLRRRISEGLRNTILEIGYKKLGCKKTEVEERLARVGERFERDSPLRKALDDEVDKLISNYNSLRKDREQLREVVRRYVRTPSFLVRFFPLNRKRFGKNDMLKAMDKKDRSGMTLRQLLEDLFIFLDQRCSRHERQNYLDALKGLHTGLTHVRGQADDFQPDEIEGEVPAALLPNVRLVNGDTERKTRSRLMLAFNTPFYPEVLIASSVLAEGVDLHLNCRHVIHHDLCWNPSTLEQRTGRVDRIGAKVERCGLSVRVYLPYVAATQDEKMYRVVMDRERWFNVVMGEKYKVDLVSADRLAERIPLPETIAKELMFDLSVC